MEVDTPVFSLPIKGMILWIPPVSLLDFAYEAFTLYGRAFQPTSAHRARECGGPNPTSHYARRVAVRFVLRGFQSPLLTASRLLSLPALTKMFQFCAFAFETRFNPDLELKDVQLGDPWFKGCMRLATAYPSLPGPSSPLKPSHPPDSMGASFLRPDL